MAAIIEKFKWKKNKKSGKRRRATAFIKRIRRNQKYRARQKYGNNFEGSSDEDDVYAVAEDESTVDNRDGDEMDYPSDPSFSESDLSDEERKKIYNLVGVEEEPGLKHMYTDSTKTKGHSESDKFKAYRYYDLQNMSTEDYQQLLLNPLSSSSKKIDLLSPIADSKPSMEFDLKKEGPDLTQDSEKSYDTSSSFMVVSSLECSNSLNLSNKPNISFENPSVFNTSISKQFKLTEEESGTAASSDSLNEAVRDCLQNKPLTMKSLIENLKSRGMLLQCISEGEAEEMLVDSIDILTLNEKYFDGNIYYSL
ncbi:unnamed protein product [Hymenolepis diminuta]|nr:unnamed protein product [Hymenolepis diminuta]VUZ40454.1 unnamed protein product [Hymenolepis diminuta]